MSVALAGAALAPCWGSQWQGEELATDPWVQGREVPERPRGPRSGSCRGSCVVEL